MSVTLFTTANDEPFTVVVKDDADLKNNQGTFKKAEVTRGTWIFYVDPNYNSATGGGKYLILKVENGRSDISSVNGSLRFVPQQTEGVVLYEHNGYGGIEKWVEDHSNNVNGLFPSGTGSGVSSAIVLSNDETFEAFNKPNYQGLRVHLSPGKFYPSAADIGLPNDSIQSIRKS